MELTLPKKTPSTLISSIRRGILRDVPHYGFNPSKVDIRKNTTAWHNDYMRLRISQIPIIGIENSDSAYNRFITENPYVVDGDNKIDKNDSNDVLSMSISTEHTTSDTLLKYVTTDDCMFAINGRPISNPYKSRVLLCTLRFGEAIEFIATTDMDVPRKNPIYSSVGNAWFIENEKGGGYTLYLEPRFGISGKQILARSRDILLRRLYLIYKRLQDEEADINKKKRNFSGEIRIFNDNFTIPELLTYYLQHHDAINFAGYKCEHMLGNVSVLYYQATSNIIKIIEDVIKKIEVDSKEFIV